jgi:hypothetical protein
MKRSLLKTLKMKRSLLKMLKMKRRVNNEFIT